MVWIPNPPGMSVKILLPRAVCRRTHTATNPAAAAACAWRCAPLLLLLHHGALRHTARAPARFPAFLFYFARRRGGLALAATAHTCLLDLTRHVHVGLCVLAYRNGLASGLLGPSRPAPAVGGLAFTVGQRTNRHARPTFWACYVLHARPLAVGSLRPCLMAQESLCQSEVRRVASGVHACMY